MSRHPTEDHPKKIQLAKKMCVWMYYEGDKVFFTTEHDGKKGFDDSNFENVKNRYDSDFLGLETVTGDTDVSNAFFQHILWKQLEASSGEPIPETHTVLYNHAEQERLLDSSEGQQDAAPDRDEGAPLAVSAQVQQRKCVRVNDGTEGQETNMLLRAQVLRTSPEQQRRVCIINPMNEHVVGGGAFVGAYNLEEGLCRVMRGFAFSLLAHAMESPGFCDASKSRNGRPTYDKADKTGQPTPWAVYTQGVAITHTTEQRGGHWAQHDFHELEEDFEVDVVGNAAVPLSNRNETPKHENKTRQAIRAHLHAAAMQNPRAEVLLLTDFGCGGFNNDPKLVGKWYAEEIVMGGYNRLFDIEFCIIAEKNRQEFKGSFDSTYQRLSATQDANLSPVQQVENPEKTVKEMSDHAAQIDRAAGIVGQNLQGPYAIKQNGKGGWVFDLPQEHAKRKTPLATTLETLTGMNKEQCDQLLQNIETKKTDPVTYLQQLGPVGLGDPLGQGGFRFCIETTVRYQERMHEQITHLINTVRDGAQVLCLQEQYYDLPGERIDRVLAFKTVMRKLGYVQMATLQSRDVGIWVKKKSVASFRAVEEKCDLKKSLDALRGCGVVDTENKRLVINMHMDRSGGGKGKNANNAYHIERLIELQKQAMLYATQNKLDDVVIQGDFNLFQLNDDQVDQLKRAGFKLEPVKCQEYYVDKKNYEARVDSEQSKARLGLFKPLNDLSGNADNKNQAFSLVTKAIEKAQEKPDEGLDPNPNSQLEQLCVIADTVLESKVLKRETGFFGGFEFFGESQGKTKTYQRAMGEVKEAILKVLDATQTNIEPSIFKRAESILATHVGRGPHMLDTASLSDPRYTKHKESLSAEVTPSYIK
jgi:predicted RNase H-like HicB family nuclease